MSDFEIDTAKVRQAARGIRAAEQDVQGVAGKSIRAMQSIVESELVGSTAEAMQDMLAELDGDVKRIAAALNTIQNALITYAEKLEEKDREMAAQISG